MPTLVVEKSYSNPPLATLSPPAKVEVAVVEVAVKYDDVIYPSKTALPATESFAYGDVVPIPRLPAFVNVRPYPLLSI